MRLFISENGNRDYAKRLCGLYGVEEASGPDAQDGELRLVLNGDTLSLTDGELSLCGDFSSMLSRLNPGRLSGELLVKAAKRKTFGPGATAVDATAGLGEDAILLAAAGFSVRLYEKDPVIAALLDNALYRAAADPKLSETVARMELIYGDSIEAMKELSEAPEVILLDPMFPKRQKSALIKKKFQLLQQLERPCGDEEALLNAAVTAGAKRILIKRPLKGPYLAGRKPDYSLEGKAIRYDCIVRA